MTKLMEHFTPLDSVLLAFELSPRCCVFDR